MLIYIGQDLESSEFFLDLKKENLHTIFLAGATGSGKSVLSLSMYKQMMEQKNPKDLGFIFFDMTRVDFASWQKEYLHFEPVFDKQQALELFEVLAEESTLRAQGKADATKTIVMHIEECDMVISDRKRFENAWEIIAKNKDKNNMYLVCSTSRPNPNTFTDKIRLNTDLRVIFNLANIQDCQFILGEKFQGELVEPWKKILVFNEKKILIDSFSKEYLKKLL